MSITSEQDSRLAAVQEELAARDLQALVVFGMGDHGLRGHIRYLTGHNLWDRGAFCVILPEGDPILVLHTVSQRFWAMHWGWVKDVRVAVRPIDEVARLLAEEFRDRSATIGIVGLEDELRFGDYRRLSEALGESELVDATDLLLGLEVIKSPVEQESLRYAARVGDQGYRAVYDVLRPGCHEWELNGAVQGPLFAGGAFDTMPLTLHRAGEPYLSVPQDRHYEAGELVSYSIEIPSPDGYWIELARMFSLGEPDERGRHLVDVTHDVHRRLIQRSRPGTRYGELTETAEEMVQAAGLEMGIWIGHSIGINLPEWPPIVAGEPTPIEAGMVLAIHPHVIDPETKRAAYVGDTVIVTDDGAEVLSELPLELTVLPA